MMKIIIIAILFAILCCPKDSLASATHGDFTYALSETATIDGFIINGHPLRDTIRIELYRSASYGRIGAERTNIITDSNGRFHFKVSGITQPARVLLYLFKTPNENSGFQYMIDQYLLNPGDSIQIQMKKAKSGSDLSFSGPGSAVFHYQHVIDSVELMWSLKDRETDHGEFYNIENWQNRKIYMDSLCSVKQDILNRYRNNFTPETFYILQADIVGKAYCNYLVNFYNPDLIKNGKKKYLNFYAEILSSPIDTFRSELVAHSPYYLEFLTRLSFLRLYFNNDLDEKYWLSNAYSQSISENYNSLKWNYHGYLREILCLNYLTDVMMGSKDNSVDSCMTDLQGFVATETVKSIVNEWQNGHGKNKMAYDFALPNPEGRIVHMKDFKGKVILLDVWFTGCAGCLEVAQQFKNTIYKQFNNNPNLVFVSISGDRNKSLWLKSVKEENYTRRENVNLYTDGLGFDHPFMKYYFFYGGPYLMIVGKNGRIYTSNPPIHGRLNALAESLKDALAE